VDLSIIICTYNPNRTLLRRVLAALPKSMAPLRWEVLIVDNASQPPLSATEFKELELPLRVLSEPVLGILHARITSLKTAAGAMCVFLDDDNIIEPDYLQQAMAFMNRHPEVGALGGSICPEFETAPLEWTRPHLGLLALRNLGPAVVISNWGQPDKNNFPWNAPFGAGMVIRGECVQHYLKAVGRAAALTEGRRGFDHLGSCEDAELLFYGVLEAGMQVAYSPDLKLTHVIPARRLTPAYLNKLAYEGGITWGGFCVRHGLQSPIAAITVPLRALRAFLRLHAWTPPGRLAWKTALGRFVGRSRKKYRIK
jgi:glycosyltransferase involved in cell wall biosynthesis